MRPSFFTLLVGFFLPLAVWAQSDAAFYGQQYLDLSHEGIHRCSSMPYLSHQVQQDPAAVERMKQIEAYTQRFIARDANQSSRQVYTIPVVVHVVYRTNSQNISAAQVQSQIDILNADFRRTNSDATNRWSQAADTEIEFCLASVDPSGNPTTGITRTSTKKRSFRYSNDGVKFNSSGGKDAWATDQYLNMWVCDLESGLLGYAQFPGSGSAATDGVVMDYLYFGSIGTATAPFDLGRTTTHEVGHWLNLRHIWGDGPCGADDFVGDTPLSDAANYGCATGHISCSSEDMVQNYMDYSDDACMNLFTSGQATRMQAVLAPGGFRASLANSPGCGGGGTGPTCAAPGGRSTSNVTNAGATFNWSAATNAVSYNVRYREVGTTNWTTASTSATSFSVSGLATCTGYEWEVETVCSDASSGYSLASAFTTGGCSCSAPSGVTASRKGRDRLVVTWNSVAGATSYECDARPLGGTWVTATTNTTSVTFNGAQRGTTYEYRVRTNCSGTWSSYSGVGSYNFRTAARLDATAAFGVYPNPVDDLLTVEFGSLESETVSIRLIDLAGRTVISHPAYPTAEGGMEIPTDQLEQGIYLLEVSDGAALKEVIRVVVTH